MLVYVVIILLSNAVSHHLSTSTDSELSESERLGNTKIFIVILTPSGSSVWKARLGIRPATACEMRGALYLSLLSLYIHGISIDTLVFLW